jgi:AcrR family transcriptional regulator
MAVTATRARRTESEHVRRAQLLRAARKVFRAKGYDGASVAEIVHEAGVAQGTFYLYFPSKKAAAVSLRDGLMETMARAVAAAVESRTSFEDRLESLIAAAFKVARKNADLFRLAFIGADERHPEMHSESQEHASLLKATTDLFRGAVDAGEMEAMDPEIAARLAIGLLQHAMIEAFVFGEGEESDRLEQGVSAMLLNALRRRTD